MRVHEISSRNKKALPSTTWKASARGPLQKAGSMLKRYRKTELAGSYGRLDLLGADVQMPPDDDLLCQSIASIEK
jgi:hypothetical protein